MAKAMEDIWLSKSYGGGDGTSAQSDDWAGCYSKKSNFCTYPSNGVSCENKYTDYTNIERVNKDHSVRLQSIQANQIICYFSLAMKATDAGLINKTQFGRILLLREMGGTPYIQKESTQQR
ncbi:hypothetical protein T3H00_11260 [Pseudomonas fluorescens]|uniref:hypothetical protein n=1 Tax=Pseudomonas fluorescens TaxID=294 RepID=UPI002ACAD7E9|nr:hypothetical protein [Pseudomonas fluorescens]MDZ5433236.1 hypothetical protein [Pseudomonas fluorescens]